MYSVNGLTEKKTMTENSFKHIQAIFKLCVFAYLFL